MGSSFDKQWDKTFRNSDVNYASKPIDHSATVVNERGGKQSGLSVCFDCIPQDALRRVAEVLEYGRRKYGKDNWRNIEQRDHLNHALAHINSYLLGEASGEDDLAHAAVRLLFAIATSIDKQVDAPTNEVSSVTDETKQESLAEPRLVYDDRQFYETILSVNGWRGDNPVDAFHRTHLWNSLLHGDRWLLDPRDGRYKIATQP